MIKKFNEGWSWRKKNDEDPIANLTKTKDQLFLDSLKKDYSERTDAENIVTSAIVYSIREYLNYNALYRYVGAIEATLMLEGYLPLGKKFELSKVKKKFLFIEFEQNERYHDFIIRKGKEYLKSKGVL